MQEYFCITLYMIDNTSPLNMHQVTHDWTSSCNLPSAIDTMSASFETDNSDNIHVQSSREASTSLSLSVAEMKERYRDIHDTDH